MPIRFTFVENGQVRSTLIEGVVTVSENPPILSLMTTEDAWQELIMSLDEAMIMALALEKVEKGKEESSRLYLKDEVEGRERITDYKFISGYKGKDVVRQTTSTKTTLIKQLKPKEKPVGWMWSGNKHGH